MNKSVRQRPLGIGPLRAFDAVARRLSFRAAGEELHLTQSAISRQVRALEDELGAALFQRGTRHVELTPAGQQLRRALEPMLQRLDATVRQIRVARGRRQVSVSTFASFASLWLLPRLPSFQQAHPDIDIRVSATDALADLDDPELDVVLRYCHPDDAPAGARRLFGEVLGPVVGASLAEQVRRGRVPPLDRPADLTQHTLLEEEDQRPSGEFVSWRHWLQRQGVPTLQPARWVVLNYTYQQIQAALAGQGVALARLAMVDEPLQRGDLVEPFGPTARAGSPYAYWLARGGAAVDRPELQAFEQWLLGRAAGSRAALGEAA